MRFWFIVNQCFTMSQAKLQKLLRQFDVHVRACASAQLRACTEAVAEAFVGDCAGRLWENGNSEQV